jgi:hypothetical protein
MKISSMHYNIIFFAIVSVILIILIFKWINYLTNNNYIVESKVLLEHFTPGAVSEDSSSSTSHTVNLPLTTTYSCKNFCGPTARCSITGQQCFADIDCSGCQPNTPPLSTTTSAPVPGNNAAGKLTFGATPTYSPLTSGYGTQETKITSNMYSKPAMPSFGVDVWSSDFNISQKLFDKRYKPSGLQFMPNYPQRYSLTGEFIEDGPFPSNAPIE